MKNNKRIIAALMSAAMTATVSANIIAFADADGGSRETLEEKLKGYGYPYSKIEDASGIDVKEYSQKNGSVYYVNEKGQVMAVKPLKPEHISIVMHETEDEIKLIDVIEEVLPNTKVEKGVGYNTEGEKIIEIEITPQTGDELTLAEAKALFTKIKDDVIGYDYSSAIYSIGHPQYSWRLNSEGVNRHHFTSYSNCIEKKDEIQAVIDENNIQCHIEEKGDNLDVVADVNMSYIEEIAIASKIFNATGVRCEYVMPTTNDEKTDGTNIDMYNAVTGDANCDNQLDMADAVLIMQALANPNKYQVSAQGSYNADMNDDGITVGDAQAIQEILLGLR